MPANAGAQACRWFRPPRERWEAGRAGAETALAEPAAFLAAYIKYISTGDNMVHRYTNVHFSLEKELAQQKLQRIPSPDIIQETQGLPQPLQLSLPHLSPLWPSLHLLSSGPIPGPSLWDFPSNTLAVCGQNGDTW